MEDGSTPYLTPTENIIGELDEVNAVDTKTKST